jgi:PAS domain S-box-containing protein
VVLAIIALVSIWIGIVAWRRRQAPGALGLAFMMAGQVWWTACYALQLSSAIRPEPFFWSKLTFVGITMIPAAFLIFSLQYTNRGFWVNRRLIAFLVIEPIIFNLIIWTDRMHNLFTGGYRGGIDEVFIGGIGFWLHSAYSYLLLMIAGFLLLIHWLKAPPAYRRQAFLIILGLPLAISPNFLTIFQLNPWPGTDLSPLGFSLCGLTLAFALFRYGLFDLMPIAREAVVEWMTDGVLILNMDNRIVDLNPAAEAILGLKAKTAFGLPADAALAFWPDLALHFLDENGYYRTEIKVDTPDTRYLDLRMTMLRRGRRRPGGRLMVLRDITKRKQEEEEKNRLLEQTRQDALIKTELLKEINHRVKNNLMSIIGLILYEKSQIPEAGRPYIESTINNLNQRMEGLLHVHQMLSDSEWAPVMLTDLAEGIIRAVLVTAPLESRVSVHVEPSTVQISPRQANNLALLFNELATNTVKYAVAKKPDVTINCRVKFKDGLIVVEYRDDGPGYPLAVLEGEQRGVGLSLIRQLVTETLRGHLLLGNDDGAVTTLHIRVEDVKTT